jgi:phage gpG-like protein
VKPSDLPGYLGTFARDVLARAAVDAADAMAQSYQSSVVRSMKGPSPSSPGTPPARRTGTLARSVRAEPATASGAGRASSSVAPHTVYARIQQLGGDIHIVRAQVLTDGKTFFGTHVRLPARPYMTMDGTRRNACHRAAVAAVQRVIREASGG